MHPITAITYFSLVIYFLLTLVSREGWEIWAMWGGGQLLLFVFLWFVSAILSVISKDSVEIKNFRSACAASFAVTLLIGTPACMATGFLSEYIRAHI